MARSYKGIELLDAFGTGNFLVWTQMTLAHFATDLPETHDLLTAPLGEAEAMIEALPESAAAGARIARAGVQGKYS
jgi:hypothetical protein